MSLLVLELWQLILMKMATLGGQIRLLAPGDMTLYAMERSNERGGLEEQLVSGGTFRLNCDRGSMKQVH